MRRLAGWPVLLLLSLPWVQPAGAAAAIPDVWTGDRTITAPIEIRDNASLEIAAGANLTFDVPSTMPADLENNTPSLTVKGGLLVNGTNSSPVTCVVNEILKGIFHGDSYLYIVGNGTPAQFVVRNCTFRNMLVYVENADGDFSDCVFHNCDVKMVDSPGAVRNCSFLESTLYVKTVSSDNMTLVNGCDFSWNRTWFEAADAAIYAHGNARIEGCNFSNFYWPIYSYNGSLEILGCHISGAFGYFGIYLSNDSLTNRHAAPVIRDTVIENCEMYGIFTAGPAIIKNCTLSGSRNGLTAMNFGSRVPFEVVAEGNRLFNNSEFGIQYGPPEGVQIFCWENNTFDDGHGLTNGKGRLGKLFTMDVEVVDQWGSMLNVSFCWTDACGNSGGQTLQGWTSLTGVQYHIDNTGVRKENFPISLVAENDGVTCRTAVDKPANWTKLVLTMPPSVDIAILSVSTVPVHPRPGDYFRVNVSAMCTGKEMMVSVLVVVNGTEYRERVGLDPAGGNISFLLDWQKAKEGKCLIEVQLDPRNEVHETDEGNNNLTIDMVVAPRTNPAGFNTPLVAFSVLLIVVLVAVVLSAFKGRKRKMGPLDNGVK